MNATRPGPPGPEEPLSQLQRFAAYVSAAARAAGYDIDSPRGGGKAALGRDAGIDRSSISRLLRAERGIDPSKYEGLARALRVPLRDLIAAAGITPSESTPMWPDPAVRSRPITPDEAATELGITDPVDREMFRAMVDRLRRDRSAERNETDGGAAAEA
ncbi:helix-turn-helix domain-containing protein [Kitasatospora purpeofusca]|uniref:helix-turn-helix domain-containing protein n=1 Tax=Kitasatospora purpeofusca TaxID=67352 RepID=UPI0035D99565